MRSVRLLVVLLFAALSLASPAGADVVTGTDAVGDAPVAWTDVTDHWSRYDAKRLDFYVRVRESATVTRTTSRGTSVDNTFPLGLSVLVWISVDGDDEPDAVVELTNNGSGELVASTYTDDPATPCASRVVGAAYSRPSGPVYAVPADLACLGHPAAVRYAVDVVQEPGSRPGTPAGSADAAPESGLTGEVVRAATGEDGYWLLGRDGGVFSFGEAAFYGSTGDLRLNRPVVGMAAVPDGRGYWFVASDGGVFSFGSARFFGSTGDIRLNQPIVGMASTPSGRGYWLVASDGGIFSFGDAAFYGSTGNIRLNKPIVGMAASPSGGGYWFVASDGGVFSFGDAGFYGSAGNLNLQQPVTGMAATSTGRGYWFVAADGGVFTYGDAGFAGSASGAAHSRIVGIAA